MTHRIWKRSDDPVFRAVLAAIAAAVLVGVAANIRHGAQADTPFASQIARLSEEPGYFDTDNLISNERSYLEVIPELDRRHVTGGAYVGVGPDQNFSYIAHIRPSIAFIIDIRRDNLLLHLLFKALFHEARTRVEYLALLFGRPVPADLDAWRDYPVARLAEYVNRPPLDRGSVGRLRTRLDEVIGGFGVPLSAGDRATIDRFHRRFIEDGLGLQFQSAGRQPQTYYPTYGDLLLATDTNGRQRNYLASEDSFEFIKLLEQRDRIVPVVGNLSGPAALSAIGKLVAERGDTISAFYASNVEFYLERDGSYPRFVSNLSHLPRTSHSVIIRSIFNRGFGGSRSVVQPVDDVVSQFAVVR